MLVPAFTFVSVFGTADFRVGRPAIEFLIRCTENHFYRLTGFSSSCGVVGPSSTPLDTCNFHSDLRQGFIGGVLQGADEGVVLGTVFQDESGSQPNHVMGFLQGQQVPGFLLTHFDDAACSRPAPSASTVPRVCSLTTQPLSASIPGRTATARAISDKG